MASTREFVRHCEVCGELTPHVEYRGLRDAVCQRCRWRPWIERRLARRRTRDGATYFALGHVWQVFPRRGEEQRPPLTG